MFRSFFLSLQILILLSFFSTSAVYSAGAGILIYANIDDTQYLLLADHKQRKYLNRGWSDLAGTIEEGESAVEAAIREVSEESNGIYSMENLQQVVDSRVKVENNGFTVFFAMSHFQLATHFSNSVVNLKDGVRAERGPFTWIPWSIVTEAAKEADKLGADCEANPVEISAEYLPDHSQTNWYFCAFLRTIKIVDEQGGLPKSAKKLRPLFIGENTTPDLIHHREQSVGP